MFHGALWTWYCLKCTAPATVRIHARLDRTNFIYSVFGDFLMQPCALRYCKLVLYLFLHCAHMMIWMSLCPLLRKILGSEKNEREEENSRYRVVDRRKLGGNDTKRKEHKSLSKKHINYWWYGLTFSFHIQ